MHTKKLLWKNKKAVNDISIITGIIILFVALGTMLPFIREDFGQTQTTDYLIDDFNQGIANDVDTVGNVSAFNVIISIFKLFFWTFGEIPLLIDALLFIPLRIILVLTIARNIWIGGGG